MERRRSSLKVSSRMYGTLSLALLCVVFVSHGLLVWGHDPWFSDDDAHDDMDDEIIDFTDMVNYDPVSKKMINKNSREQFKPKCDCDEYQRTLDKCSKDLNTCEHEKSKCEAESIPVNSAPKEPCSGEEMFFRRFARHMVDKLAEEVPEDGDIDARISVSMDASSWRKLKDFVYNKKGKMAEAYDEMTEMLSYVDHTNTTTFTMWLEDVFQMDRTYLKLVVVMTVLAYVFLLFEQRTDKSWGQQLKTVVIVFIIISIFWNWIYLYKKEVAHRMAELNKDVPEHCLTGKMYLWDTFKEAMRSRVTFDDDPCKLRNERIFVDPIYEVPPTKAISHTFATLFLDPLKYLGKAVAEFNHELFANLPFQAWIPALLSVYGGMAVAVYIIMKCSWSYGRPPPQVIYREMPVSVERLAGNENMPRIEDVPFEAQDPEPEAKAFLPSNILTASSQDVRRRSSNRSRKTVDRQDINNGGDQPEQQGLTDQSKDGVLRKGGSRGRSGSTSDSDGADISVLNQGGEGSPAVKPRRRQWKRSESPPKLTSKSSLERSVSKTSDGGRPMTHPESEQSSMDPSSLLMRSVEDSSTLLVASTRHMPPTSLGGMEDGGQTSGSQDGSISSDGSTPTLSPPQCNTPSSISVVGDEASLASSDDMTQDNRRPALETLQISVSGDLEPELLGAEGRTSREGCIEDDDDFEVLHKEQIP